jgi:hypothetical protein
MMEEVVTNARVSRDEILGLSLLQLENLFDRTAVPDDLNGYSTKLRE